MRPTEPNEGGPKSNEKTLSPAKGGGGGKGPLAPIDTADRGKEEGRFRGRPLLTLIWVRNLSVRLTGTNFVVRQSQRDTNLPAWSVVTEDTMSPPKEGEKHPNKIGKMRKTRLPNEHGGKSDPSFQSPPLVCFLFFFGVTDCINANGDGWRRRRRESRWKRRGGPPWRDTESALLLFFARIRTLKTELRTVAAAAFSHKGQLRTLYSSCHS